MSAIVVISEIIEISEIVEISERMKIPEIIFFFENHPPCGRQNNQFIVRQYNTV